LESQSVEAQRELDHYKAEYEALSAKLGAKNDRKKAATEAEIAAIRKEEQALRAQIDELMKDEAANDEAIGKLQDKIFRMERKIRNKEKGLKAEEKELAFELERVRVAQKRAQTRVDLINQSVKEVNEGKLPSTVEKKRSLLVRLGGTVQPALPLNGVRTIEYNNTNVVDTIGGEQQASVNVPLMYTAGFTVGSPNKWTLGADLRMQDWSNFNYFNEVNTLGPSMRVSVGGEYIPKYFDLKYSRRIAYRVGAYYHQSQIVINGEPLQEFGISLGTGLPIGRFVNETQTASRLNLGVTVGKSGNLKVQPLEEMSVRFVLGLNLNDLWFRKWRLD
jgi:hypothetical protein